MDNVKRVAVLQRITRVKSTLIRVGVACGNYKVAPLPELDLPLLCPL